MIFVMCFENMKMFTADNEAIVYSPRTEEQNPHSVECTVSLSARSSVGDFRYIAVRHKHFNVWQQDYAITRDTELIIDLPASSLGLSFNLKTDLPCHIEGVGASIFYQGQYNLYFLPALRVKYQLKKGDYTQFGIEIDQDYLTAKDEYQKILPDFIEKTKTGRAAFLRPGNLYFTGEMMSLIAHFIMRRERKALTEIYVEARALELIRESFEGMNFDSPTPEVVLPAREEGQIHQAIHYLKQSLAKRVSIALVASKFNLSPKQLSQAFKAIHGISLKDFIYRERMQLARQLLERDNKSVKETAHYLRYGNATNFSSSFKKYFGYEPSSLLRLRKRFTL